MVEGAGVQPGRGESVFGSIPSATEHTVSFPKDHPESGPDKHEQARRLVEAALRAQARGDDAEAERLFDQAQRTDPEAVANVLQERDAALTADLVDATTSDEEVAAITETLDPDADAPPRAGISGAGSGADSERR